MGRYNDLSALKALKKEMEKKDSGTEDAPPQQKRRSRTVVNKSKAQMEGENAAKERCLRPGCAVTLMDSNDRGILRHVHKDCVEIEIDGLLFRAGFNDFIVNDAEEDSRLIGSIGGNRRKEQETDRSKPLPNEISIDLHIEKIPSGYDAPKGFNCHTSWNISRVSCISI